MSSWHRRGGRRGGSPHDCRVTVSFSKRYQVPFLPQQILKCLLASLMLTFLYLLSFCVCGVQACVCVFTCVWVHGQVSGQH